jgi:hypothetical protein
MMPKINKIKPVVKKFNRLGNQLFSKRVVQFFTNGGDHQKNPTCKHFLKEGKRRSTILRIIDRYLVNGTADYQHGKTNKRTVSTPETVLKLDQLNDSGQFVK